MTNYTPKTWINGAAPPLSAANVQIIDNGIDTAHQELEDHITDTVDAHDASAISNVAAGGISATTVQAAIDELDTEKVDIAGDEMSGTLKNNLITPIGDGTGILGAADFRWNAVFLNSVYSGNAVYELNISRTVASTDIRIAGTTGYINFGRLIFPVQAPTATAPDYVKGGLYFNTTTNKLMVGGAAAWEAVTSA